MTKNKALYIPCGYTCDATHNHGVGYARFNWHREDPLAVRITACNATGAPLHLLANGEVCDPVFHVARDILYTAVRSGRSYGCPIVGEGAVTCKVIPQSVTTLSIRWGAGAIMWVDRDDVSHWIDSTYTIVGTSIENQAYDIDGAITRILEGSK